jgi:hypothetical protein
MDLKTVIKQFLFSAFIAGIGLLSSCSSDDGSNEMPDIPDVPIDSIVPDEKPFVGVTYMEDSVRIQLQLLNSDSVATDTFKEGEDIIFKLTIKSISNDLVMITPITDFSDNIFDVYSSNGTYAGRPWDGRHISLIHSFLTPEMLQEHTCSWLEEPVEDLMAKEINEWSSILIAWIPIHYYKTEYRQPLSKGSYYTQFDVSVIEGKTTTIRMDFNIE